jgi:hypothetical protein
MQIKIILKSISPQLEWPHSRTQISINVGEDAVKQCWECKLVQPLWKTVQRFLKKLKLELPYDPVKALVGI